MSEQGQIPGLFPAAAPEKPVSEGPAGETPAQARDRLRAFLAGLHTGPDCDREPATQFKAPGTWTRGCIAHINVGHGKPHLWIHRYTCLKCGITATVES